MSPQQSLIKKNTSIKQEALGFDNKGLDYLDNLSIKISRILLPLIQVTKMVPSLIYILQFLILLL